MSEFRRGSPSANEKPRAAPASASHLWGAHPADAECVLTHVRTRACQGLRGCPPNLPLPSLPQAVPFSKSPIWSVGQFLMVHLLCFKYGPFGKYS